MRKQKQRRKAERKEPEETVREAKWEEKRKRRE